MIDRHSVVSRHNPVVTDFDPLSPLTVGNGEFAITVDATGLQTYPERYADAGIPLGTLSNWGWHSEDPGDLNPDAYRWITMDCAGTPRPFAYLSRQRWFDHPPAYEPIDETNEDRGEYLTRNPHRWHLGQIGLCGPDGTITPDDIEPIKQELDLWTGVLTSRFRFRGRDVTVQTACHPQQDVIAVSVQSDVLGESLSVVLRFGAATHEKQTVRWDRSDAHTTELTHPTDKALQISRRQDADAYGVSAAWQQSASVARPDAHSVVIAPDSGGRFDLTVGFSATGQVDEPLPNVGSVLAASSEAWEAFWQSGAAVDLDGSTDPRAAELERRVVLSQYLTRVQCCGHLPPQESGLTFNSWGGKFHLEMHWWHAVHFALWNRPDLLTPSLEWYESILPVARETARRQGFDGARWPKQIGPVGQESPSSIGCFLLWQQPHPIFYAELLYRHAPTADTLARYRQLVDQTTAFMASVPQWFGDRCHLEPMLIPLQENHSPFKTRNPGFELAYWRFGLQTAQQWRERLEQPRQPEWDRVLSALAEPPVGDGLYLAHENCPETYSQYNYDHPGMLGMYGMLPGEVNPSTMRRTLEACSNGWRWQDAWGWDFPMAAMCAARLGDSKAALDLLLMDCPKNRYLTNGHNWQGDHLPAYLPGNGGLLAAVAMLLAGWDGPGTSPELPKTWRIRHEGLRCSL